MRRLDIGVVSYKNPDKLRATLESIERRSTTDWRCIIVHNPSDGDQAVRQVIAEAALRNPHFEPMILEANMGYAGGVNKAFEHSNTEYFVHCDNDIEIHATGWDEAMCAQLDRHHEIGIIFPNGGAYQIDRGDYQEVLWGVGFCFMINRMAACDVDDGLKLGPMDESIGHQEEADLCQRVRMAGWRCAALPEVRVAHHATATNDPASVERINRGVVRWVDKWNRYFNGKNFNYHSPNVTRFEDWPPNALYLEEYWRLKMPDLNKSPEVMTIDGRQYDLIKVPRFKDFYRGRII